MELPTFNEYGLLPPGDYAMTFDQLRASGLVQNTLEGWDSQWRLHLVNQCEILVQQLWQVGIDQIFLDGSFVEDKLHPNDIDGYFVCDAVEFAIGRIQRKLNALDPYAVWTWSPLSRKAYRDQPKKQLPMWHRYRVEFYPHYGQSSGIKDQYGHELEFPAAFRRQKSTGQPKGIIQILKEGESP